ncbi:MAG: YidC/Oxa1 family membrane protein insertase [Thermincola sp.]|nr:YidC/Oxa1 family membrane protein insertase [Thermincola sp.]MDT3701947.1 YidC/Oxa1 family membrane protein insertase [Thermincola sp.]
MSFDLLVNPMTEILNFFYNLTKTMGVPSYGLAIIFLTILIKMALFPLSVKQMRSLKITQQLQPKIKAVQEKYKNEPQKAQAAVMEIYKQYGANPLSGCLPLLVQMPILIALYQTLYNFKFPEAAHASFLYNPNLGFWIENLKQPDKYLVMPILAVITTFALQKMTTNVQDQTQKTMLYVMPLFIGFITYSMPSGLGLYWVVTNIVGAVQQYFINKQPLPVVIKEEVSENEGSRKKRKNDRRGS